MPYLDADGLRVHVQELGPAGGPPVVMLHGLFTGNLAAWYFSAAPAVAAAGHRVRLIDQRGHGLTDRPPTGYHREQVIADLHAATADLAPFAAVGHSYGALLALRYAIAHPGRVRSLALVEPPLGAGGGRRGETADRWIRAWARAEDPDAGAAVADARGPEAQVQALLDETSILADLDREEPVSDEELRAVEVPLLFLFGDRSPWAAGAERVARVRPDAPCQVLPGGHGLPLDAKAEVAEALVGFLGAATPGPTGAPGAAGGPVADDDLLDEVPYG